MGAHGKESMGWLDKGAEEMTTSMLKAVGVMALAEKAMELFGEAVNWTKESIHHADFIRDLDLSLQAYTGSAEKATQVIDYFRESQIKTRNTAEELQQTFRNLNPLANAKGFTLGAQEQITVMLSQVATVANKSLDEIEAGYKRILATGGTSGGGGAGRNPLLQVLGITGDQLKHMGWDEFLAKIQEASARSAEFGQSWESTMHKAEDALKNAFAEGFNDARGSAVQGMDAITAIVKDPQIVEFLHDAGVKTAEWIASLAGVAVELRGIISLFKQNKDAEDDWAVVTLGLSKRLKELGQVGLQKSIDDAQKASNQTGANVLGAAGITRPLTAAELLRTPGGASMGGADVAASNISAFHDLPNLQKMVGDIVTADHMNAEQLKVFTETLRAFAGDSARSGLPLGPRDLTMAGSIAMGSGKVEGAPSGPVAGKQPKDLSADIKAQTDQLIAQAGVLDLQNQKLGMQAEMDQIALQLGEKKTGLEGVVLDSITQQLLTRRAIVAQQVVDTDQQQEYLKAISTYDQELAKIAKERLKNGADQGLLDNQQAVARQLYVAAIGVAEAKTAKARTDATDADQKANDAARTRQLAADEALIKLNQTIALQRDQNEITTAQTVASKQQAELSAIDLALSNQKAAFGGVILSNEAASLLHQHETLALQQVANETEVKMQEERKRYEKERFDLAKQRAATLAGGFTGEGVNPAINQQTLLAAAQAEGDALKLNAIQAEGANAMMAANQRNRDYQTQTLDVLLKGYGQIADVLDSAINDAVTGLLTGNFKGAFSGLADEFRKTLAGGIDDFLKQYVTRLQKTAQGTATWNPNAISADGEGVGAMVTPSASQQNTAKAAMIGAQGAMALYSLYQSGQHGATATQNTISGASMGASVGAEVGGVYGAVIGAIVGAIAGYFTAGSKASYTVSISNGQIAMVGGGSAKQSEVNAALGAINQTIQAGATAVHGLFDAFPIAVGQQLGHLDMASIFKQTGTRWFDDTTLKLFMAQDVPAMLLSAYTPIIQSGLASMGVAESKIKSLFSNVATSDPANFFKFITDYVTGFVAMKNTIDFLGKSSADKTGVAAGLASPALTDQLAKANENIAYIGQGFDKLTNTDQVARLGQINAAIAQRYQLEIQALNDVANARKAVNTSYAQARIGFRVSGETPEQQLRDLQNQRDAVAGSLNDQLSQRSRQIIKGAQTPAEVVAIANSYATLTQSIYSAAKSLRDSFQSVLDSFAALDKQKLADKLAALDPTAQLRAITGQATGIASAYGGMSQADQISNSQTLLQLATQYYNVQKQALIDLGNSAKSIHDSITKQIFGIQLDQLKADPQAQIEMLLAQQRTLYASIGTATTAQQVNDIISQISGNVSTISGLEGNTPQAAADSIKALQEADKAAQLQLAALTSQAKANDDAIQLAIKGVTDQVTTTIGALNTLMTNATTDLVAFGVLIQAKLDTFVTSMMTSDAALLATLQPIFLALGNTAANTSDGLAGANAGLIDFTGALKGATDGLTRFVNGNAMSAPSSGSMNIQFTPSLSINVSGDMGMFVKMIDAKFDAKMQSFQVQQSRFARNGTAL